MAGPYPRINLLSTESQARIKSSVHITSMTDVVLELVKNALDANAGHIDVRVDFSKGYCSVLDDGHGILEDEFLDSGALAQPYCTSKHVNPTYSYGKHGRFLASLSSISLLSITSLHVTGTSSNLIVLKDGKRIVANIDIQDEDLGTQKCGTKVVVHNLFGHLPVRVKQRLQRYEKQSELAKDFSSLKESVIAIILGASQPFCLDMQADGNRYTHRPRIDLGGTDENTSILKNAVSTLFSGGLIESIDLSNWRHLSLHSAAFSMTAAISLVPSPTKSIQFISLNRNPLFHDRFGLLFDQINGLFNASNFGTLSDQPDSEYTCIKSHNVSTVTEGSKNRRSVDRWPMFCIRINSNNGSMAFHQLPEQDADKSITFLNGMLHTLITEFLRSQDLKTSRPRKLKKQNKQVKHSDEYGTESNFDCWSRIKSANSVPVDILAGLPFIRPAEQGVASLNSTIQQDYVDTVAEQPDEAIVSWVNPRTGSALQINSRTGMEAPSTQRIMAPLMNDLVSYNRRPPRHLSDVIESLRDYVPLTRAVPHLKSITTSSSDEKFGVSTAYADILDGATKLQISGPVPSEPAWTNVTKHDLETAKIVGQVDKKFILASLNSSNANRKCTLVLIDQHAADERIKVEELLKRLCTTPSVTLPTPIVFESNQQEMQRFRAREEFLASWNIYYRVSNNQVHVIALPELIVEKCRLEPKLLIDLLRSEIWQEPSSSVRTTEPGCWLSQLRGCPQGMLDMVASRACRSAIMFNDELTLKQSQELVGQLRNCLFPFQCAHGRPSLTVLATLEDSGMTDDMETMHSTFGHGWKAWVN